MDIRNTELAKIFIEHSLEVNEGDNVVISTSDLVPMDLIREVYALALQKKANVYLDIMGWNFFLDRTSFGDLRKTFYNNASLEQINNPPTIYKDIIDWGDKFVRITSLDNFSHVNGVDKKKLQANSKAYHGWFREMVDNKPWVLTYYPTEAFAQKSGMSMSELEDIYFDAVLVDYAAMKERGVAVKELVDGAKTFRIVGEKTDLTLDVTDRIGSNSCGKRNVPDGEVYYAPVHTNTEGYIYYDLPFAKTGGEINGAYLEFKNGKVVKATAEVGEDILKSGLDSDEGAKYLGELGIGLNYGVEKVMKNTIFDEKIGGTLHITLGEAYPYKEGGDVGDDRNISSIHWDLVKDMRKKGSYIEVDGVVKFRDGKWLV